MSSHDRRATERRRAWGRGPKTLRFEPLEGRQLLAAGTPAANLVAVGFDTPHNLDWGGTFHAQGRIENQGTLAADRGFSLDVYASATERVGDGSVRLGSVEVPVGLAPGQAFVLDRDFDLPPLPIAGMGSSPVVYIGLVVDGGNTVAESNELDNLWRGQGFDTSVITITPRLPVELSAATFRADADRYRWGDPLSVVGELQNSGPGEAPASRARLVLTPVGQTPGGAADVTVGSLIVPAVPAYQTIRIAGRVALPATAPSTLAGTAFLLTIRYDADHEINPLLVAQPPRGLGFDQAAITIEPGQQAAPPAGSPTPDLTAAGLLLPAEPLAWGQTFQVAATIQNRGTVAVGESRARFLLTGPDGSTANALVLDDATLPPLPAGASQPIVQTLKLPGQLPPGAIPGPGTGRIVVQIDPENTLDEGTETNNAAASGTVALRVLGADGQSVTPPPPTPPTPPPAPPPTNPTRRNRVDRPQATPRPHVGQAQRPRPNFPRLAARRHALRVFRENVRENAARSNEGQS